MCDYIYSHCGTYVCLLTQNTHTHTYTHLHTHGVHNITHTNIHTHTHTSKPMVAFGSWSTTTSREAPPTSGTCWVRSMTREKRTVPLAPSTVRESAGGALQGRTPTLATNPPWREHVTPSHDGLAAQIEVMLPIPPKAWHWVG